MIFGIQFQLVAVVLTGWIRKASFATGELGFCDGLLGLFIAETDAKQAVILLIGTER